MSILTTLAEELQQMSDAGTLKRELAIKESVTQLQLIAIVQLTRLCRGSVHQSAVQALEIGKGELSRFCIKMKRDVRSRDTGILDQHIPL